MATSSVLSLLVGLNPMIQMATNQVHSNQAIDHTSNNAENDEQLVERN